MIIIHNQQYNYIKDIKSDIQNLLGLLNIAEGEISEPNNYKDIFNLPNKNEWLEAVGDELNNMKKMNVYSFVDKVPDKANIIESRWVLKYKRNSNGEITKYKARLVAKGYTQVYGVDYFNTFSPTLKQDTTKNIYLYRCSISIRNTSNGYYSSIFECRIEGRYLYENA